MRLTHAYLPADARGEIRETTLDRILVERARATPGAPALARVEDDGALASAWSYERLRDDAAGLSLALLSRFAPGARLAVRAAASPERVRLVYAAAFAGLTVVAIPPASDETETLRILEHSGASGLFADDTPETLDALRRAARRLAGPPEVTSLRDEAAQFAKRGCVEGLPEVRPDDPAMIAYGAAPGEATRGVRLSHRGLANAPRLALGAAGARPGATGLALAGPGGSGSPPGGGQDVFEPHAFELHAFELGAAQLGCRLLLAGALEAGLALDLIDREAVGFVICGAGMLRALCAAQARRPRRLDTLELVLLTGAGLDDGPHGEARARLGCRIVGVHGAAETSGVIALTTSRGQQIGRSGATCRLIPGMEASIRDPRTNAIKAIGAPGEVCVRGFATMIGYNRDAVATAATLHPDGWLRTGLLGAMDSDGAFVLTGRLGEQTAERAA